MPAMRCQESLKIRVVRYAALGANLLYFLSAPLIKLAMGTDPLEPRELELRRKAAVEYLGQTIFTDREHGARIAARVLAATPMPETVAIIRRYPSPSNKNPQEPSLKK